MEEWPSATQARKNTSTPVWGVINILASLGVIFFLIFLVMQVNALEQIVDEQNRLTLGIRDKIFSEPSRQVLTEVRYAEQETFINYVARRAENVSRIRFEKAPAGFEEIFRFQMNNCHLEPEEGCGSGIIIYARPNWSGIEGEQSFYLGEAKADSMKFYGPYMDDLQRLMREAKHIKELTDLIN